MFRKEYESGVAQPDLHNFFKAKSWQHNREPESPAKFAEIAYSLTHWSIYKI